MEPATAAAGSDLLLAAQRAELWAGNWVRERLGVGISSASLPQWVSPANTRIGVLRMAAPRRTSRDSAWNGGRCRSHVATRGVAAGELGHDQVQGAGTGVEVPCPVAVAAGDPVRVLPAGTLAAG